MLETVAPDAFGDEILCRLSVGALMMLSTLVLVLRIRRRIKRMDEPADEGWHRNELSRRKQTLEVRHKMTVNSPSAHLSVFVSCGRSFCCSSRTIGRHVALSGVLWSSCKLRLSMRLRRTCASWLIFSSTLTCAWASGIAAPLSPRFPPGLQDVGNEDKERDALISANRIAQAASSVVLLSGRDCLGTLRAAPLGPLPPLGKAGTPGKLGLLLAGALMKVELREACSRLKRAPSGGTPCKAHLARALACTCSQSGPAHRWLRDGCGWLVGWPHVAGADEMTACRKLCVRRV